MLTGVSIAQIWYEQNFDELEEGELVGQDEWATAHGQQQPGTVQKDVAFGDEGKSVLVEPNTYVIRQFKDAHADTQYVSFYSRIDSDAAWMNYSLRR